MIGFDLYPLQNWCRYESFADVYEAQRELVQLAAGKPTFQWIEVETLDCPAVHLDPTPEAVRAEMWLAIAGGAGGIGYFPNRWNPEVGAEIARTNRQIKELAPALLAPAVEVSGDSPAVKVGARTLGGPPNVVAVNATRSPVEATITLPGLAGRSLAVFEEARAVAASGETFRDAFAPLAVHVYVAPSPLWAGAVASST